MKYDCLEGIETSEIDILWNWLRITHKNFSADDECYAFRSEKCEVKKLKTS